MGVMNKSVSKDGLGWTRRNWETPEIKTLKWYEWSHTYRQRVYFGVTRTVAFVGGALALFAFGWKFLPFSEATFRQTKRGMFPEHGSVDTSESLRRRYSKLPSVKSELDRMTTKYSPETITTFRGRMDDFIRRTADRFLGESRSDPERELYNKLEIQDDSEMLESQENNTDT